jgi:hypothetical protein
MRIIVCVLLLGSIAASHVAARDSRGMLRDRLLFGGQFVIEEPDTALISDLFADDCCFSDRIYHSNVLHHASPQDVQDSVLLNPKGEFPGN